MHLSLKVFAVILKISVSTAECRLHMLTFSWQVIAAIFNMSMTVLRYKYFQKLGKVAKGMGIYWWVMYLNGDVFLSGIRILFCKKKRQKNGDCSSVFTCLSMY